VGSPLFMCGFAAFAGYFALGLLIQYRREAVGTHCCRAARL